MVRERGGILLRVGFVAVLGGGLMLWSHLRKPRDCTVELDLTRALPGEVVEVDLIIRRGGKLLERSDLRYGTSGAPSTLRLLVHAAPGEGDVEATLLHADGTARRTQEHVTLSAAVPARVLAR